MRRVVDPAGMPALGPYSMGVISDGHLFCSGQTPIDPATAEIVIGGVGGETRQCFANLFAVLAEAGLDPADVVKVNVYLIDMNDFDEMNTAYAEQFDAPYPARTTVAVAALPLGASVEIELVAKLP